MIEIKPIEPSNILETNLPKKRTSGAAVDPGQTQWLRPKAANDNQDLGNSQSVDFDSVRSMAEEPKAKYKPWEWFKKLSQSAIIWISLSIILIFLVVLILLITQGRQKSKVFKSSAGEQLAAADEIGSAGVGSLPKSKLARQADKPILLLTDDEFAGQAPLAVKASGPVISTSIDPELAAIVDALKIRLKISADSKSINRKNTLAKVSNGDFRGFKINIVEKTENPNMLSEEIIVTTPQKGVIKTVNRVLESVRECDLERFTLELQNAGLEIIKLPIQPGNKAFQVQIRTLNIFGKSVANDMLISGKSVGKISLGMPTTQLETMLLSSYIVLKRKVLVNDFYYDVYKILDQSNEPLFFVYENKGRVWGIAIISEIFKTWKGIGINSSLGNMRINYPQVNVGISEKRIPFVKIDGVDGLFIIQSEGVDILKQIFPSKTKIISILIGNSLEFE